MASDQQTDELSVAELRALVPQLQQITEKYKRAESVQKALFKISDLAGSISELSQLYPAIHQIIGELMNADNFFVAFHIEQDDQVDFVYVVDDTMESELPNIPMERIKKGLTGHILRTGEHLFLHQENLAEEMRKRDIEMLGKPPVDFIGVPLRRGNQVEGVLVVQSYDDSVRYSAEDLEVLLFVSLHIMTTVDRVKSRELTERTIRERTKQLREINDELQEEIQERQRVEALQQALFEISELSATVEGDITDFFRHLHDIVSRLISAPNFYIAELSKDRKVLEFPYFSDQVYTDIEPRPLRRGLTEYVLETGQAAMINPEQAQALVTKGVLEPQIASNMMEQSTHWLGSPLVVEGETSGVIVVQSHNRPSPYTSKDLELLRFVSHHIAVAMERKRSADAVQEYNQQLADKVKERTNELNRANNYLKRQIDQRKEIELKLIHDAHHDALTGLPNRAMFSNRLELALANKKRYHENHFAVLFIDLDRFKLINDTLGHHAGDLFLVEVANRIGQCIRGHDLLARLGGDEFVILLDNFDHVEDVEEISGRILETLARPFALEDREMYSGGSIGIAFIEPYYQSADEVIRDADAAMYQAKATGRGRFVMFDQGMRNKLLQELELESAFRQTLKASEFECYFQPVCGLANDDWHYLELFIRWQHPTLGKVKREQFWQVAEQSGLTIEMDNFMLERACYILEKMQHLRADGSRYKVAVNLSINHLLQSKLVNHLIERIQETGIDPADLVFEFDENALNRRSQFILPAIRKLKSLGITLVLDNFGSGLASLSYLYSYPFDYVKVDHRFVKSLPRSEKNLKLIQSVLIMSDHLDFQLIAEGVENQQQLDALLGIGCKLGQGKFLSEARKLDVLETQQDMAKLLA